MNLVNFLIEVSSALVRFGEVINLINECIVKEDETHGNKEYVYTVLARVIHCRRLIIIGNKGSCLRQSEQTRTQPYYLFSPLEVIKY